MARSKAVIQMNENREVIGKYESITKASEETGISIPRICMGCRTLNKVHRFYFDYEKEGTI